LAVAHSPAYPPEKSRAGKVPLWLRLEYNIMYDSDRFLATAEGKMRRVRLQAVPCAEDATIPMVCWVHERLRGGCRSDYCRHSFDGRCPLVHVTYLTRQHSSWTSVPSEACVWDAARDQGDEAYRWRVVADAVPSQCTPAGTFADAVSPLVLGDHASGVDGSEGCTRVGWKTCESLSMVSHAASGPAAAQSVVSPDTNESVDNALHPGGLADVESSPQTGGHGGQMLALGDEPPTSLSARVDLAMKNPFQAGGEESTVPALPWAETDDPEVATMKRSGRRERIPQPYGGEWPRAPFQNGNDGAGRSLGVSTTLEGHVGSTDTSVRRRMPWREDGPRRLLGKSRVHGVLASWSGRSHGFGWIVPEEAVDHPSAKMHRGRVFVSSRDADYDLMVGDQVSFRLYSDANGLGAEDCRIASRGPSRSARTPSSGSAHRSSCRGGQMWPG